MSGKTILVVDDDEAIQSFIGMSLMNEGYEVETASDGQVALEIIAHLKPSLILLDLRMPTMDGRSFIKAYRQTPSPHAPIVIMTAGHNTSDTTSDMNVSAFLSKPFDLDDLLALITEYTSHQSINT